MNRATLLTIQLLALASLGAWLISLGVSSLAVAIVGIALGALFFIDFLKRSPFYTPHRNDSSDAGTGHSGGGDSYHAGGDGDCGGGGGDGGH